MHTICPWCDAEIVWDEEIGPEENCPHCENELGEYRSVAIDPSLSATGALEDEEVDEQFKHPLLHGQQEWLMCAYCEEAMIHLGRQTMTGHAFQARTMRSGQAVIHVPFQSELFLCPSCDRLEQVLSLPDKEKWQAHVLELHSEPDDNE